MVAHEPLSLPPRIRETHADWTASTAWSQIPECTTWRLSRGREVCFAKVAVRDSGPGLGAERDRLIWAARYLPVPQVLDHGMSDGTEWLLTAALPGEDAIRATDPAGPRERVEALARGLRTFHAAPIHDCPFRFELDIALPLVRRRVEEGLVDAERHLHPEHRHLSLSEMLGELETRRPAREDLVLCHGDYCLPNVMLRSGRVTGYLDLGELGVADQWWDLAVATWSVTWNLGVGWQDVFLRAYGVEPDPERTTYFRMLYDLAS